MEIRKSEQKKRQASNFISGARYVLGFTFAPTMGALIFYLMLNVPLFFGYKLPAMSLSVSPGFLLGGTLIAGSIFYAPTVIIGLVIMMLIRRYFSWSFNNCVIGGALCAFAVASLFLVVLLLVGQSLVVAGAGSSMILSLIIIPSVMSGMSFWLIAVYKNRDINLVSERNASFSFRPAFAGNVVRQFTEKFCNSDINLVFARNAVYDRQITRGERLREMYVSSGILYDS